MEMTLKKEESVQINIGQSSAVNGTLPFERISEDLEADEHAEFGPSKDSVSEEKQSLMSDKEMSSQTDPELHKDGRNATEQCMYDTERFNEPKLTSDPNSHLLKHREGFLDRSSIIGPLKLLACATTQPAKARGQDFCNSFRIPMLKRQQNITYFSELRRMNVTICQAVYNRMGKSMRELNLDKGDFLQVLESDGDWWKLKNHKGEVGHAPYIILQVVYGPGMEHKPKGYFSRRKHVIVIVISVAIIAFIVIIGVLQIKRRPIV
ncbi:hypothetical protein CHS0354_017027 [Potamilus streckersoni]|uniref:SH3 domain-containing protein n=1 Tax=Potamilus streckersoni TaxID=2493646 RepID=A0AAE0SZS7_9BIVA|nr:hypothetical protein CHS0354_017027 [Potamilus streckersoni]